MIMSATKSPIMPKMPPLAPTVGLQALCVTPAKKAPAGALKLSDTTGHWHRKSNASRNRLQSSPAG